MSKYKDDGIKKMKSISDFDYHITILTCAFLGFLGIHRFINKKYITGLLMLFSLGGLGIWVIVDFILIISGKFDHKNKQAILIDKPVLHIWSNIIGCIVMISWSIIGTGIVLGTFNNMNSLVEEPVELDVTMSSEVTNIIRQCVTNKRDEHASFTSNELEQFLLDNGYEKVETTDELYLEYNKGIDEEYSFYFSVWLWQEDSNLINGGCDLTLTYNVSESHYETSYVMSNSLEYTNVFDITEKTYENNEFVINKYHYFLETDEYYEDVMENDSVTLDSYSGDEVTSIIDNMLEIYFKEMDDMFLID